MKLVSTLNRAFRAHIRKIKMILRLFSYRIKVNERQIAVILLIVLCIALFKLTLGNAPEAIDYFPASNQTSNGKIILFWTQFFDQEMVSYLEYDRFIQACPVRGCFLTSDRRYLKQASAVVFHMRDTDASDLPQYRHPDQLFVFFLVEAPPYTTTELRHPPWPGFFNLTWTYRDDSDIYSRLYVKNYQPYLWSDREKGDEKLRSKQDKAMAMISNCGAPSNRDGYIMELQRYFPVDVVGDCGTITCKKGKRDCTKLYEEYKFYLAFENSLCRDYMTEKAMRALTYESLPVFLGMNNYSAFLPPHSFLDVADYQTPTELANKLHRLTADFDAYKKYFDWKYDTKYLQISEAYQPQTTDICQLCELLNRQTSNSHRTLRKTYDDLHEWWVTQSHCYTPYYSSAVDLRSNAFSGAIILLIICFNLDGHA